MDFWAPNVNGQNDPDPSLSANDELVLSDHGLRPSK